MLRLSITRMATSLLPIWLAILEYGSMGLGSMVRVWEYGVTAV
jgi:hypothetical protein